MALNAPSKRLTLDEAVTKARDLIDRAGDVAVAMTRRAPDPPTAEPQGDGDATDLAALPNASEEVQ